MATRQSVNIDLNLHDSGVERGLLRDAKAADKFGDSLEGVSKESGILTKKISETEAEVKKLVKQFDETGDMDLLKSIRKEQSNLRIFERLSKSIASEAVKVGTDAGEKIGEGLTKSLMALRGPAIAAAVGIGVILAPAIGSAISAAVIGAAGAGGIVGGIAAAAQDQRVQAEAKRVADHVGSALTDAGGPFVEPLIESLRLLDDAGDRLAKNFQEAGTKIAPTLVPLTKGLTGFVGEVMPGFIKAMDAAKPVIRAIGAELPKIGAAVSDFFTKISDDPDQAVMAIVAISQAIQGTIEFAGDLLATLGDIFEWSSRTGAAISGTMETLFGWLPVAGDAIKNQGQNFRDQVAAIDAANDASKDFVGGGIQSIIRAEEEVAKITKTATEAIEDQLKAMDKMFDRVLGAQELASNYQESIDNLTKSVQENGKSLDIRNEAGRENLAAMRAEAEAIEAIRKDIFEKTGDMGAANTAYDEMIERLRQHAYQMGLNKEQVDDFIAALKAIPAQTDVEVRAPGLLEAIARAQYLNRLLGSISAGARARGGDTSGYGGGRAGGGPMDPGKWYTVGENGVEVVSMHPGGGATVYNNKQTGAMMSGASGGASMGGSAIVARPVVNLSLGQASGSPWDPLIEAMWPHILKRIRVDGGDLSVFGAA
jgi:hypothetical protein